MKRLIHSLLFVVLTSLAGGASAAPVEVVMHPDAPIMSVSQSMLRAIFTMRLRQWPDGQPVRVYVLPDHDPLHLDFCRERLGVYPYVMRGVWDRLVYTGTGFEPTVLKSEKEMILKIKNTRGAIGYVSTTSRMAEFPLSVQSTGVTEGAP